jgi:hypothetical protein
MARAQQPQFMTKRIVTLSSTSKGHKACCLGNDESYMF